MSVLWKGAVIIGVFLALFGTVFTLQGEGVVGPSSSFMFNSATWVYTGLGIAILGLIIFIGGVLILRSDVSKARRAGSQAKTASPN